ITSPIVSFAIPDLESVVINRTLRRMNHTDKTERQPGRAHAFLPPPATVRTRYAASKSRGGTSPRRARPGADLINSPLIDTGRSVPLPPLGPRRIRRGRSGRVE